MSRSLGLIFLMFAAILPAIAQQTIQGRSETGPLRMGKEVGPKTYLNLRWVQPSTSISTDQEVIQIQVQVSSSAPLNYTQFRAHINGVDQLNAKANEVAFAGSVYTKLVGLQPGINHVYVSATNGTLSATTPTISITYTPAVVQPNLHVFSFGPTYSNLRYTSNDAIDFVNLWKDQKGPGKLFKEVFVTQIINDSANRNAILGTLEDLKHKYRDQSELGPNDVYMIFYSGHGIEVNGQFYLEPYGASNLRLTTTYVKVEDLTSILNQFPGTKIVFLDACRFNPTVYAAKGPIASVLSQELQRLHEASGVQVFASCSRDEKSYEHDDWQNGAFTEVLIKGLKGAADKDKNKVVSIRELESYLIQETPRLNIQSKMPAQHPEVMISLGKDIPLIVLP